MYQAKIKNNNTITFCWCMGFRQADTSTLNNGFLHSEFPVSTIEAYIWVTGIISQYSVAHGEGYSMLIIIYHTVVKRTKLASTVPNWPIAIKWAIFFLLRMWLVYLQKEKEGQNLEFVYTPNHSVVSKTTQVCTAVYNANAHSKPLILINLDLSEIKQATTI